VTACVLFTTRIVENKLCEAVRRTKKTELVVCA